VKIYHKKFLYEQEQFRKVMDDLNRQTSKNSNYIINQVLIWSVIVIMVIVSIQFIATSF
jgi:hypothetical protein